MLEFLTTARMLVRGSKLDRKWKAAIALEVKVPEDIEVYCCGKWHQDWRVFVKDLRQLSSCYARRFAKLPGNMAYAISEVSKSAKADLEIS